MKRLFTNINTYEFNSQEDFYKSIIEELKGCKWVKKDNNKFLCESVPSMTFYKMTAIDFEYFEVKDINFRYEIIYSKLPDGQYSWEVNFYENEERQYSDYLLVENDDLGLFSSPEEQEEQEDEDPIKLLKKALILCAEKEINTADITSVIEDYDYDKTRDTIEKLREECNEKDNQIDMRDEIIENLQKEIDTLKGGTI